MHGDRRVVAAGVLFPDCGIDLRGRKDLTSVLHEQLQDAVLGRCERDRLAVHLDALALVVQHDAADGQHLGPADLLGLQRAQHGIAPELGFDARHDLHRVKWFCDVVVRTDGQPQHLVGVLALGREQDDRDVGLLPQLGRGQDAVHARHHDIHERQVHGMVLQKLQRLLARIGWQHLIPLGGKIDFKRRDDIAVIVTDENGIHIGFPLFSPRARRPAGPGPSFLTPIFS